MNKERLVRVSAILTTEPRAPIYDAHRTRIKSGDRQHVKQYVRNPFKIHNKSKVKKYNRKPKGKSEWGRDIITAESKIAIKAKSGNAIYFKKWVEFDDGIRFVFSNN